MGRTKTDADRITRRRMAARLGAGLLALALAPALAACGKQGKLESPDEKSDFPRTYPDPKSY